MVTRGEFSVLCIAIVPCLSSLLCFCHIFVDQFLEFGEFVLNGEYV